MILHFNRNSHGNIRIATHAYICVQVAAFTIKNVETPYQAKTSHVYLTVLTKKVVLAIYVPHGDMVRSTPLSLTFMVLT